MWVFGWGAAGGCSLWSAGEPGASLAWEAEAIPIDLAVRDLDGDGLLDLAVRTPTATT